mmetsp:Transcript_20598/g.44744  ORF Transcript_20598/g.44744 Transcript_20598/m.44744 type:complete len:91 (-) Transcript_20598:16-288(-)
MSLGNGMPSMFTDCSLMRIDDSLARKLGPIVATKIAMATIRTGKRILDAPIIDLFNSFGGVSCNQKLLVGYQSMVVLGNGGGLGGSRWFF